MIWNSPSGALNRNNRDWDKLVVGNFSANFSPIWFPTRPLRHKFELKFALKFSGRPVRVSQSFVVWFRLRQLADAEFFEVDGGAFGFQAKVAGGRFDLGPAGHFLTIDPQAHFTVDAPNIVMIPFPNPFAQVFRRETAAALGRHWRKGHHAG